MVASAIGGALIRGNIRQNLFTLRWIKILNMLNMKPGHKVALLTMVVLLLDQLLKVYIKTHFAYGEGINMLGLSWAQLKFVENEGMAFGITFGWEYGKLLLSLFRIVMVGGLIWYIRVLIAEGVSTLFLYSIGLITAGALGNIIDSAFYGLIFSESPVHFGEVARLVGFGEGYGTFLHGKVVDMFYFPLFSFNLDPLSFRITSTVSLNLIQGGEYIFFSPIFNVADASITTGVFIILLFQRRLFQPNQGSDSKISFDEATSDNPEASEEGEERFV